MSYNNTSIFMGDYGEEGEGVKNAQKNDNVVCEV